MFALDPAKLSSVLSKIHESCGQHRFTLATAESCTGGLLSALLTSRSGSSSYFIGGICSYSNEMKSTLLGVSAELIMQHGAVSESVAKAMAIGIRHTSRATFSVAVTGIAGPGGGSLEKPVGTVYCAWASEKSVDVERLQLQGDREAIRGQTCLIALAGLEQRLLSLSKEVS